MIAGRKCLIILVFLKVSCLSSSQASRANHKVDELDANEGTDDPAGAIDKKIAPQNACRADRPIGHAAQCQGNERDDDQSVEDDRRKNRALRRREVHDVQALKLWIEGDE